MKRTTLPRLALRREAVRTLTGDELRAVAAGAQQIDGKPRSSTCRASDDCGSNRCMG